MSDLLRKYKSLYSSTTNTFSTGESVTITPASVTGLPTDTEITLTFDRVDATGTKTPDKMERIRGTVVGSNFVVSASGRAVEGTEQVHTAPVVEMVWNADDLNDMVDWGLVEHGQGGKHTSSLVTTLKATGAEVNTGTEDAKIVTPKALADSDYIKSGDASIPVKATAIENVTGTDDAKFITALANVPAFNDSIFRQAIINGNFDVWQRGTSIAMTAANDYTADRWYCETATAGTDKTVSREDGTGVNGSYYCARVKMVGDVDELLTFSQALESQDSIKFRGKKVTLSFYARGGAEFVSDNATLVSKIATGKGADQKLLAFTSLADGVSQNNTLTTNWQKFTCTTTAAIATDITQLGVSFSFTHAGSGTTTNYFEITQVQLCAGDVALPFMPKSFEEELRACQRYYEKSFSYATAPYASNYDEPGNTWFGGFVASGKCVVTVSFATKKRVPPTITTYNPTGSSSGTSNLKYVQTQLGVGITNAADGSVVIGDCGFNFATGNLTTNYNGLTICWTASAEL